MKNQQKATWTGFVMIGVTVPIAAQGNGDGGPQKRMNIVYIMSDDHSYQTISAYDRRFIETPNIDWIANHGARFTNSFVANSLSGPSMVVSRLSLNCCRKRAMRRL